MEVTALARAATAAGAATLVIAAAWATGSLLLRRVSTLFERPLDRPLFELAAGLGALSFTFLALASAGWYRPAVVRAVVIAAAFGAVFAAWRRWSERAIRPAPARRVSAVGAACAAGALVAIGFALIGALAPEIEYDALWYHLWLPARWLAAGRTVDLVHEYPSLYPLTWELLFGAALTIGGPIAAKLLHFICLPLVAITTARLAPLVEPRARGAVAAAIAIVAPTMIWEATTAYVDLALAWYVALGAYALVRYADAADRRWLALSAMTFGIAMAIKNLGLVAFAIAVVALAFIDLRRRRANDAALVRVCAAFALVALLLPLPWYVRAFAASGNPVFPDFYAVFGAEPPERWSDDNEGALQGFKDHFGRERTAANLAKLPWDVTVHGARYGGTFGPIFLLLVPFSIFAGARARWLLVACGGYVAVWASPISSFQLRFLVPIVPFLAVLAAAGLSRLPARVAWVVPPLLVLNLPPFIDWHDRDRVGWTGWLTHVMREVPLRVVLGAEAESDYLARQVPSFRAWQFINATLPPSARVLTFSGGDHLYSARDRLWSEATAAKPATWDALAGDERRARAALASLRITHVLIDRRQAAESSAGRLAIASEAMRECCLDEIYEDGRFVLYRVR